MTVVAVIVGGALGAVVRAEASRRAGHWLGTLAVNVVGAFALGALVGAGVSGAWAVGLGAGACGSLTTWSTFVLDVFAQRRWRRASVVVVTVVVGVVAARLGFVLTDR